MTNALKGVLLSALVLPGLGQFMLKRRLRGTLMMMAVLCLLSVLMVQVFRTAMTILENINVQVEQVDVSVFYDAVQQTSTGSGTLLSSLLLICWLAATVDAYLIGRKLDREEQLSSPAS